MDSFKIKKRNMRVLFPKWFSPTPGFKFRDHEDSPCVVIGWGGWRDVESVEHETPFGKLYGYKLVPNSCGLVYACFYEGDWYVSKFTIEEYEQFQEFQKDWTEEQELLLSGWE